MPPDPPGRPPAPVVLRIKLRYDDLDAMVSRFAPNVGKSGLFLPTKSLQPVGSEVKFELRLANDTAVLLGLGRVKMTKPPDPANPKASFGMAIELMRVTRESRDLILRMLERRKQLGLPEVAIPMPADLDAARRSDLVDTAVRPAPAPIPAAVAHVDSQPSELLTAPRRPSGPVAVAKVTVIDPLPPEPARRKRPVLSELIERASGPVAAVTVPGLDQEVDVAAVIARARALAGGDLDGELEALREAQATPIEIGIEAASAELARELGGAAVRRDSRGKSAPAGWAPPPAVADAQRSEPSQEHLEPTADMRAVAPADPEPEITAPEVVTTMVAPEPADTVADPATAAAALGANAELRAHVVFDSVTPVSTMPALRRPEPAPELEPELGLEPEQLADSDEPPEEHEVEPEQIHDEIHQLNEADYEEVEHTQIGAMPTPSFDEHVFKTTPSMQAELAQKLDAHLAEVEAEGEQDDLGIGEASGSYLRSKVGLPPAQIFDDEDQPPDLDAEIDAPAEPIEHAQTKTLPPEYQQDFIHHFGADREPYPDEGYATPDLDAAEPADAEPAGAEPADAEPAAYAAPAYADSYAQPGQGYDPSQTIDAYGQTIDASLLGAAPSQDELADPVDEGVAEEEEAQEIDDFEILAEADEEDADLLSSSGEADASGSAQLPAASDSDFLPASRESDFAMRLDLPDDDEPQPDAYERQPGAYEPQPGAYEPQPEAYESLPDPYVAHAPDGIPQHRADLAASAGHALAAFDEEEEGSHSFTYAEPPQPQGVDFDEPHSSFRPDRFDQSDVIARGDDRGRRAPSRVPDPDPGLSNDALATPPYDEPYVLRGPPPQASWDEHSQRNRWEQAPLPTPQPSEEIDLESALEALDVDLDDLSTPHGPTEIPRSSSNRRNAIRPPSSAQVPETEPKRKSTRIPRGRAPRASTEDGVLIDFDDDDDEK